MLFVDSDDLVLPSALDFIETCIKKYNVNCDFFLFKHQCGGEHVNIPFSPEVTVDEFLMNMLSYKVVSSPWAKLYRTVYVKK